MAIKLFKINLRSLVIVAIAATLIATYVLYKGNEITKKLDWENSSLQVSINKIENRFRNHPTFVFGKIKITGQDRIYKSVNLSCITMKIGDQESRQLYFDSIASYIDAVAHAINNKIDEDVYWVFDKDIDRKNISEFKIVINHNKEKECFDYDIMRK